MSNYSDNLKKNQPRLSMVITVDMEDSLRKCSTVSEQIRMCKSFGFDTGGTAKVLNIRYQHVRNVLNTPLKKG